MRVLLLLNLLWRPSEGQKRGCYKIREKTERVLLCSVTWPKERYRGREDFLSVLQERNQEKEFLLAGIKRWESLKLSFCVGLEDREREIYGGLCCTQAAAALKRNKEEGQLPCKRKARE
jgi:hypothetical protein